MLKKHPFAPSKEKFVSPEIIRTVGVELGNDILVGSPGKELESSVVTLGHDIGGEYSISSESYWE